VKKKDVAGKLHFLQAIIRRRRPKQKTLLGEEKSERASEKERNPAKKLQKLLLRKPSANI